MPFSESSLPAIERSHYVTVEPGAVARIYFNEDRVTLEELEKRLAESVDQARHVIVLGGERADYGTVMTVANLALKQGYEVAFATTPETANP